MTVLSYKQLLHLAAALGPGPSHSGLGSEKLHIAKYYKR